MGKYYSPEARKRRAIKQAEWEVNHSVYRRCFKRLAVRVNKAGDRGSYEVEKKVFNCLQCLKVAFRQRDGDDVYWQICTQGHDAYLQCVKPCYRKPLPPL